MKDRAFTLYYARVLLNHARAFRLRAGYADRFTIWLQYRCMVHRCRARTPAPRQSDLFQRAAA
jgi:hypothetical protein